MVGLRTPPEFPGSTGCSWPASPAGFGISRVPGSAAPQRIAARDAAAIKVQCRFASGKGPIRRRVRMSREAGWPLLRVLSPPVAHHRRRDLFGIADRLRLGLHELM